MLPAITIENRALAPMGNALREGAKNHHDEWPTSITLYPKRLSAPACL